jgi:hypothetical protein
MHEELKNIYKYTVFSYQGMPNEEINKITKEIPVEEDICKYMFRQNLYLLQLERKGKIQFWKPATIDIKVFFNECV